MTSGGPVLTPLVLLSDLFLENELNVYQSPVISLQIVSGIDISSLILTSNLEGAPGPHQQSYGLLHLVYPLACMSVSSTRQCPSFVPPQRCHL